MVTYDDVEKVVRVRVLRRCTISWFPWLQIVKPGDFGFVGTGEYTRSLRDY